MKKLFPLWMSGVLLLFITSCTKENSFYQSSTPRYDTEIYLEAGDWKKDNDGNFVNEFAGVLQNYMPFSTVSVYLEENSGDILISQGTVTYMSGDLWATWNVDDLTVFYHPDSGNDKPFDKLRIKVVLE